ncbi:fumarylacetoacetate hydrolase [Schizosaccharomyces cryophilus OY26]|uniref:Fumarylacetoacetate hydrolase n=1 Tax=Schizosaccharomyces cryophilus (strain OY26 / ATCC MYA-4695 / CBS 11777 / NBRC 106824 / NRRL Y48691) TaxID=653667 RepID=S9XJ46_SCHCR|nr:fumarylacetoacetate hydrolase [Schizosaccharomyces cryophilus OY26]EPY53651.1 fumarylacetoacetate hydrolase [Schizosaccharomyces cryophilus OY26]
MLSRASKILCIGRNYAAHIRELNNAFPKKPFFFLKPPSAIVGPGQGKLLFPSDVKAHYEVELGLVMGSKLPARQPISHPKWMEAIAGYFVGIDVTARNIQDEAKKAGLPWTFAKGYDTFLPVGPFIPKHLIPDPHNVIVELSQNKNIVQHESTSLMLNRIPRILESITEVMSLQPGDLILTGTPKGVGQVFSKDVLSARLLNAEGKEIIPSAFSIQADVV